LTLLCGQPQFFLNSLQEQSSHFQPYVLNDTHTTPAGSLESRGVSVRNQKECPIGVYALGSRSSTNGQHRTDCSTSRLKYLDQMFGGGLDSDASSLLLSGQRLSSFSEASCIRKSCGL